MNKEVETLVEQLAEKDDTIRYAAFTQLLVLSEKKVTWVYEVWDTLVEKLGSENSFQRSIGLMLLCNLSQSDSEKRMSALLPRLLSFTKDEKFITSRQTLQAVWKIAWFEPALRTLVVEHLKARFVECENEKHPNLLRQDILQSLLTLADLSHDETLQADALKLVDSEKDEKSRKSYLALMKAKK